MKTAFAMFSALAAATACAAEPIVGGPCEGCEAVFQGLPAAPPAVARIGAADEPGERLRIDGRVRDAHSRPVAGVIVYAYQTDAAGIYPTDRNAPGAAARRHGRLRAWAQTDANGRFGFDTIRPASYPRTDLPQHVHMHVIEPGRCTYYIDDLVFTDDPLLTPTQRRNVAHGRGGDGVATPIRDASGRWQVQRDITLGAGIADYTRCDGRR